jgi:hypothetical protein
MTPEPDAQEWLDALNRAATYYRQSLKEILDECSCDEPRVSAIRDWAERGVRAADYELDQMTPFGSAPREMGR